ncbi:MAG: hypothetical protein JSS81_28860 [Acidobacteria bacterium]|nr:hypothetical protein [Acidobacteriota bacterium]
MNHRKSLAPPRKIVVALIVLLVFLQTGCGTLVGILKNAAGSRDGGKNVRAGMLDPRSPFDRARKEIGGLVQNGDFKLIDALANEARADKLRLEGGYWKLDAIYEALGNLYADGPGRQLADADWQTRIEALKRWRTGSPGSITARVALAEAYVNYGWFARGGGYVDSVSEDDLGLFKERLALADRELNQATELNLRCPRWFREKMIIQTAVGDSAVDFEQTYEEAIHFEPDYLQFYLVRSAYLTPKWHGAPGEWEAFVAALPAKLGKVKSKEIDIVYFVVVTDKLREPSLSLDYAKFDKMRLRQGFVELDMKYGADNLRLNQFAHIACLTGEFNEARNAFKRIGGSRDDDVWNEQTFTAMQRLAFENENGAANN